MHTERERLILDRALDALQRETGLEAIVLQWEPRFGVNTAQWDALIGIADEHEVHQFVVEIKHQIDRFDTLQRLRLFQADARRTAKLPLVVVAPFFTVQAAEQCRKLGMCFADTAGNAYLKAPGIHIYIAGKRRPLDLTAHFGEGRAVTPAGMRILFAFLCQPNLINANYREIAIAARVALGTVGPVIRDLEIRKHVTTVRPDRPNIKRRLLDPKRLFHEWVTTYPTILRPKLNARRFRARDRNWTEALDLKPYRAYWGGEVAAARLTHNLAPEVATIYAQNDATRLILDQRMKADINGDVEVLEVFWNPEQVKVADDVVPPILAYADLVATTDGRNLEVAQLIYDQHIDPHLGNQA